MKHNLILLDNSISPRRKVWSLAWPTILEQLLMMVVIYVDAAMVGSIGVNATAAIAVNTTVIWLIQGLMSGLAVGASVLVAKKIGEGNPDEARDYLRQAILGMLALGIFVTLVGQLILAPHLATWMGADEVLKEPARQYMRIVSASFLFQVILAVGSSIIRCSGDTKTPMLYNILNNVVNIVANAIFIYPTRTVAIFGMEVTLWGAGMGVGGAAMGTSIAAVIAGSLTMCRLFSKKFAVAVSLKDHYRFNRKLMTEIVKLGLPAAFERITLSSGQILTTAMVTGMGSSILAAHQLATTAESVCYMPVWGFHVASTTLTAQSLGAGEKKMAKEFSVICMKYGVLVMVFCATMMFIFAPQMIGVFIRDSAVIAMGAAMLRIEAFAEPCVAISEVCCGVLKGAGDTRWPFYVSVVGMWCVRLPLAFIAIKFLDIGLAGIWIPMALDWTVRMILNSYRYKSGSWLHHWDVLAEKPQEGM